MRLLTSPAGPQPDGLRLGCVQIADRKIEMHLFRDRAARPGRRLAEGRSHGPFSLKSSAERTVISTIRKRLYLAVRLAAMYSAKWPVTMVRVPVSTVRALNGLETVTLVPV